MQKAARIQKNDRNSFRICGKLMWTFLKLEHSFPIKWKLFFTVLLNRRLLQEFSGASKWYQFLCQFLWLSNIFFLLKLWLFSFSFIVLKDLSKFKKKHCNTEETDAIHDTAKYIKAVIIFSSNLPVFVIVVDWNADGTNLALKIFLNFLAADQSRLPAPKAIMPSNYCPCSQPQRTSMWLPTTVAAYS